MIYIQVAVCRGDGGIFPPSGQCISVSAELGGDKKNIPPGDATPPTTNKAYRIPKIKIFFKTLASIILQHVNTNSNKIRNAA